MLFILCKDDCLSNPIAASHMNTTFHQILKHHIYRHFIKDKLIHRRRRNKFWHLTIFHKIVLIPFLILIE